MHSRVVLGLIVCLFSNAGQAAPPDRRWTGETLLTACEALLSERDEELFEQGRCVGFVVGIDYANIVLRAALQPQAYCRPNTLTIEQSVRVLVDYLKQNAPSLKKDAGTLTLTAFHEAYPCLAR